MTTDLVKPVLVFISAHAEWKVVKAIYSPGRLEQTPFGEWFTASVAGKDCLFVQGGWGKISAAASTQYAIDRWQPEWMINLGTCGGFAGCVERGTIILVERTLVYDILEQMSDPEEALKHYSTTLDLHWLREPLPHPVWRGVLVSADRDLLPADLPWLRERFGAVAADWESGAIAWVAARNHRRCLILRGVSDLVSAQGGEAYGAPEVFHTGTESVMRALVAGLPAWLRCMEGEAEAHSPV
ncbi:MAG TPA: hypothetical protein DEQ80_03030 [Anaerolinea thermolimosa]|uniref:Nucleoside phosphorylase domain-containing protein n=1 Tax=Anaerolinea thermolimosa TaxID=229919 RepID=A0A3D1JE04_9CHLR|nr:5'-methylthioadenosine/S-adenosylhomocysteine nucleosidase [Anaerolinea thermolimosa]GAP05585.1 nucleoside phosphorylase [Anaerolinea thermolimosa]HCE16811.1 hypothetical protein [Anaerolinea thermolimosa]